VFPVSRRRAGSTKQAKDQHQDDRANETADKDPPAQRRGEDDLAASRLFGGIPAAAPVAANLASP
jgi:hypothetical protein